MFGFWISNRCFNTDTEVLPFFLIFRTRLQMIYRIIYQTNYIRTSISYAKDIEKNCKL